MEAILNEFTTPEPSEECIADLLRADVSASGSVLRSTAVRRIQMALGGDEEVKERIGSVCERLEVDGDFNASKGGVLNATPLRFIGVGGGRYRVIGSAPERWLRQILPGELKTGLIRELEAGGFGELERAVKGVKGVILSPEAWAGFEFTPEANAEWLEFLNGRLTYEAKTGQMDPEAGWQAFVIHQDAWRWRHSVEGLGLWRAWMNGYYRWVWSTPGQDMNAKAIELTQDEGTRTCFALARAAGVAIPAHLESHGEDVRFWIEAWLPRAEYRYLRLLSKDLKRDGSRVEWTFTRENWERVYPSLNTRLGIEL